ncbi:hypothetical protein K8Q96_02025 [Candidatus Nomurabacteria bacterium]|nr:hypothetical protein [Candidatus Nomurabacteria bacterium]
MKKLKIVTKQQLFVKSKNVYKNIAEITKEAYIKATFRMHPIVIYHAIWVMVKTFTSFMKLVWDTIAWSPYNIDKFFFVTKAEKAELLKAWNACVHEIKSAHGKNSGLVSNGVLPVIGYRKLLK